MKLVISKKSGRKFPPPFEDNGKTIIAIGKTLNMFDPKKREAYVLENGSIVNCEQCYIIEDLDK